MIIYKYLKDTRRTDIFKGNSDLNPKLVKLAIIDLLLTNIFSL